MLVSILTNASLAAPMEGGDNFDDDRAVLIFSHGSYYKLDHFIETLSDRSGVQAESENRVSVHTLNKRHEVGDDQQPVPEWLAYVRRCGHNTQCGAAVISKGWALLQVSCFPEDGEGGTVELRSVRDNHILATARHYIPLPQYSKRTWNDIALLKLEEDARLSEYPLLDTTDRHDNAAFEELSSSLKHFDNQGRNVSLLFYDAEKTFSRRTTNTTLADSFGTDGYYYYDTNVTVPLYYFLMDELHKDDKDYSLSTSLYTESQRGSLLMGLCSPFGPIWYFPGFRLVGCQAISDHIRFILSQTYGRESLITAKNGQGLPAVNGDLDELLDDPDQLEALQEFGGCQKEAGFPVYEAVAIISGGVVIIGIAVAVAVGVDRFLKRNRSGAVTYSNN